MKKKLIIMFSIIAIIGVFQLNKPKTKNFSGDSQYMMSDKFFCQEDEAQLEFELFENGTFTEIVNTEEGGYARTDGIYKYSVDDSTQDRSIYYMIFEHDGVEQRVPYEVLKGKSISRLDQGNLKNKLITCKAVKELD